MTNMERIQWHQFDNAISSKLQWFKKWNSNVWNSLRDKCWKWRKSIQFLKPSFTFDHLQLLQCNLLCPLRLDPFIIHLMFWGRSNHTADGDSVIVLERLLSIETHPSTKAAVMSRLISDATFRRTFFMWTALRWFTAGVSACSIYRCVRQMGVGGQRPPRLSYDGRWGSAALSGARSTLQLYEHPRDAEIIHRCVSSLRQAPRLPVCR